MNNNNASSSSAESSSSSSSNEGAATGGGCPMKNSDGSYRIMPGFASLMGKMGVAGGHPPVDVGKITTSDGASIDTESNNDNANESQPPTTSSSGGCPVKHTSSTSSSSWNILRRGGSGPGSTTDPTTQQQYDVYSRPLPMDPTNNMPIVNPVNVARNELPAPTQKVALPTERVVSSIPKVIPSSVVNNNNDDTKKQEVTTWTYPSPQMFYNALARKGKLDSETSEEDMISVVAIHNCMNEGTWERILQWEKVLNPNKDNEDGYTKTTKNRVVVGPSLTKFMGRPTDLSPKAAFKHYILQHPLPFDRHDWTVSRVNSSTGQVEDVRYVIDYYHDDKAALTEDGSGLPKLNDGIGHGGKIQSLLVDVRPAADSLNEIKGRILDMPLARRGCRSILECVLFKGHGNARTRSDFEPLPLSPSDSLKESLNESKQVWENIQKDAMQKKGVGAKDNEACASDTLDDAGGKKKDDATVVKDVNSAAEQGRMAIDRKEVEIVDEEITKKEATKLANTFSSILTQCQKSRSALQTCSSDEECEKAFMGMTVCAGQYMCPLQHSSLLHALESHGDSSNEEMAEAKINTALDVLGECVANYDARASVAKKQYPKVFEDVLKKK